MSLSIFTYICMVGVAAVIGTVLAFASKPKPNGKRIQANIPGNAAGTGLPMRSQIVVRILDKRIVTVDTSNNIGIEYSRAASRQNIYYMTFEAKDGTRTEMEIPEAIFCGCLAGFIGTLTYETSADGLRFIDFTRDYHYRVNGF